MYVITCNKLTGLNDYLVNRPGRFHYHFRFQYPTPEEIREYLCDKLAKEYWNEIEKVVSFAAKVDINYDCLRAIAFELNNGILFEDAILDLNIMNIQKEFFNVAIHFESGARLLVKHIALDLFGSDERNIAFEDENCNYIGDATFVPAEATWINELGGNVILGNKLKWKFPDWLEKAVEREKVRNADPKELAEWQKKYPDDDPWEYTNKVKPYEKPTHIHFIREMSKSLHYTI